MDPSKIQPKAPKPPMSVPGPSQPPVAANQSGKKANVQKTAPESVPEPSQPLVPIDLPQKASPTDAPPKRVVSNIAPTPESVNPDELQPPAQNDRSKRKGPAPKPVASEEPRPPLQNDRPKGKEPAPEPVASEDPRPPARNYRPKRKGPSVKPVAPEKLQPPVPGGKPKRKEPTPGPSATKKDEPIEPAAAEKPRKKTGPTRKKNIPASSKPATQDIKKVEGQIEEPGPIQQVMGNLPEKPKGHDYFCAICYTNMTRMNSAVSCISSFSHSFFSLRLFFFFSIANGTGGKLTQFRKNWNMWRNVGRRLMKSKS